MYRSPPYLRSGSKGQAVPLSSSTDKRKPTRSLSVSDCPKSSNMPTGSSDKNVNKPVADPSVIADCVERHLSSGDTFNALVARLTSELRGIVEEAVKSALTAVNLEMEKLRCEVVALKEDVADLNCRLRDRTDELEQYTRRNNIRIFGVPETVGEDTDGIVRDLCRDKLGVELREETLCRTHRVGRQPMPGPNGEKRHRPIIVRFVSYRDRRLVFGEKKRLKGSGITVREDLTARRLELLRKATALYGVRRTWTLDGKIFWLDKSGNRGSATTLTDLDPPAKC